MEARRYWSRRRSQSSVILRGNWNETVLENPFLASRETCGTKLHYYRCQWGFATHTHFLGELGLFSPYVSSSALRSLVQSPWTFLSRPSYHFNAGPERRVTTNSTFHLLSSCLPSALARVVTFLTNSSTVGPPFPEKRKASVAWMS